MTCALLATSVGLGLSAGDDGNVLIVGLGGYGSIQAAVDAAEPGDTIRIMAGTYQEEVVVTTPHLTIEGVGKDLVVLDGGQQLGVGFSVTADGVTIQSLTVKDYQSNGVAFADVDGFFMYDIHVKDNYGYGLYAIRSKNGEIAYNTGEGQGDSAIYIGETANCDCDVHHNKGWNNMLGYSGTANSHVRIWENEFFWNRAGILMNVLPNEFTVTDDNEVVGTQVRSSIYRNHIHSNNNHTRTIGLFSTIHPPVGEGITIAGGWMNDVYENVIEDNNYCGVCVFWLTTPPRGNLIHDNDISGSRYGIWWDEWGEDNCFRDNTFSDVTHVSDPDPLPTCPGLAGDLPCPEETHDLAACRASDVRAPSALKEADLAWRSLNDAEPDEDLLTHGLPLP